VPKVIERAVKDMKKGELCRLRLDGKHDPQSKGIRCCVCCCGWQWRCSGRCGGDGEARVSAGRALVYEVELVEMHKEKDSWEMSTPEKLEASQKRREQGNAFFKDGKLKRAVKRYKSAVQCVQSDYNFSEPEKAKAKELKLPCHLNMAAWFAAAVAAIGSVSGSLFVSGALKRRRERFVVT
jgi:hypothetical protein